MKNILIFVLLLLPLSTVYAQQQTEVLLLATYHFGGNTTDNLKVTGDDILGEKKQKELDVLLKKLERFNPEKIYVENEPNRQAYWDSIYTVHNNGQIINLNNELYQIGTKLASRLNLSHGVTCVDWHIRSDSSFAANQYEELLDTMIKYYDENNIPNDEPESDYEKKTIQSLKRFNREIPTLNLLDVFKRLNQEKYLDKMFYANIASFLDVDKYNLNVFWSQKNMIRNVHVYQNIIQDILKNHPQKVMIIYGAGHIKALRNYLEAHPIIKIVDTEKYLK